MTAPLFSKIIRHDRAGEVRAVLLDMDERPCRIFLQRWNGACDHARLATVHSALIRSFSDSIAGAFLELESGEEAFLRLNSRDGYTEGQGLTVKVQSEARAEKLARVTLTDAAPNAAYGFDEWIQHIPGGAALDVEIDPDGVAAAFDEALSPTITLPSGGQLHIDRTRALTAFDVDTSGRVGKGSAGARALSVNREAARELVRQMALRGLGGLAVMDCIEPLNKHASEQLKGTTLGAFDAYGFVGAKALAPSTLGLLEISLPWTLCPLEDHLNTNPEETELVDFLSAAAREATANPTAFLEVQLSKSLWQAYLDRRADADAALLSAASGRITIDKSETSESKVQKR